MTRNHTHLVAIRYITCYNRKRNYDKERKTKDANDTTRDDQLSQAKRFKVISQNGSHVKMRNDTTERQTIVPYHSASLKIGLEQAILKQAGLK